MQPKPKSCRECKSTSAGVGVILEFCEPSAARFRARPNSYDNSGMKWMKSTNKTLPPMMPAHTEGDDELIEPVGYDFGLSRRGFVQILSAGLLIASSASPALAQRGGRRGGPGGSGPRSIAARIHLGKDGSISVFTGKVEAGQGARAELTQAAAEELGVPADGIQLIMADTGLTPDDGITAGSGSSPRTVPAVRHAAAAARQVLVDFASKQWGVEPGDCEVREGKVVHSAT